MANKVINILTHTPNSIIDQFKSAEDYLNRFSESDVIRFNEKPYWVGFYKLDWHHQWGKYLNSIKKDFVIECWRPYGSRIKSPYEKVVDNIKNRVFPSKEFVIKKAGSFVYSKSLLKELIKEIKTNNIIIHFYGSHTLFEYYIILKIQSFKVPIIIQHLGGWFFCLNKRKIPNPFDWLKFQIEKQALKHVSKYLTSSITEQKFLCEKFSKLNFDFFLNGINIEKYKREVGKTEAKAKIGLSENHKMILYVGRFDYTKNVDLLLNAYNLLKQEDSNIKLFLIGGYKTDILYNQAIESGAYVIERSDTSLFKYYEASDVYVMPINNHYIKEYGGIGIAPLEAMAYNLPIISPNLKHVNASLTEIQKIGILLNDNTTLMTSIKQVLSNPDAFNNGRHFLKRHFDIQINSLKLIDLYNNLFSQ